MIKSTKNRRIAHRLFKCQSVWVWTRQKFFSVGEIVMFGLDFSSWSSSQFFSLPLCGIRLPMRLMFLHCHLRNMGSSVSSRAGFSRGGFHAPAQLEKSVFKVAEYDFYWVLMWTHTHSYQNLDPVPVHRVQGLDLTKRYLSTWSTLFHVECPDNSVRAPGVNTALGPARDNRSRHLDYE